MSRDAFKLSNGTVNKQIELQQRINEMSEQDPYPMFTREFSQKLGQTCKLILEGLTNKQIAEKLGKTEKGIKYRITFLFKAEKVKSRAELMAKKFKEQKNAEIQNEMF